MTPLAGPWQRSRSYGARLGLDCNTPRCFIFAARTRDGLRAVPYTWTRGRSWDRSMLGQGGCTATVGPVGTLDSPRLLPAMVAGLTPGDEAKLRFISGGITLC